METEIRTEFLARLAERGLSVKSYDDQTLTVQYDPEKDSDVTQGQAVERDALARYVREVILQLPGFEEMFPRLERIDVEAFAAE